MSNPFFVHFGCWNNPRNPHKGMQRMMENLLERRPPNFYLVSGDNYYPEKKKDKDKAMTVKKSATKSVKKSAKKDKKPKSKYVNWEDFDIGFDYINRLSYYAKVYLLMGNHDLDYEKQLFDSQGIIDGCSIIQKQIEFANKTNIDLENKHFVDGKTLFLLLNSHYYARDKKDNDRCAKIYRPEGQNEEEDYFTDIVHKEARNIHNLVLVAHLPIVTHRMKNDEPFFEALNQEGLTFIRDLYSIVDDSVQKYYLCADTHQYQHATIHLADSKIQQYVVGTGGTGCDDVRCPPEGKTQLRQPGMNDKYGFQNITASYELQTCSRSYGYMECQRERDANNLERLKFEYITTGQCMSAPNSRSRARSRAPTSRSRARSRAPTSRIRARSRAPTSKRRVRSLTSKLWSRQTRTTPRQTRSAFTPRAKFS